MKRKKSVEFFSIDGRKYPDIINTVLLIIHRLRNENVNDKNTRTHGRLVAALSFFFFFLDRGRVKTDQREPTVDFGRRSSLVNENKRKPTNMTLGEGA